MFSGKKYLTKGIYTNIPLEIQQFLWRTCVSRMVYK